MWRTLLVVVLFPAFACGGHGSGGGVDAPFTGIETAQFLPHICTSGLPDDPPNNPNPLCPANVIPLDPDAPGSTIRFFFRSDDTSQLELTFVTGSIGLHAVHPQVVVGDVVAFDYATILDVPAGSTSRLASTASNTFDIADQWRFHFAVLEAL